MYCPKCGFKMLLLATGGFDKEPDERFVKKWLSATRDKFRVAVEEKAREIASFGLRAEYYVCGRCKHLLMGYGRHGFYFDILGTLTDESIARLIASELGK